MRLLVVNWRDMRHPLAGGAEVHIHQIMSRLAQKYNHKILFLSNQNGGRLPSEETYDGVEFLRFGNEYNFNLNVAFRLRRIVGEFEPDLVIEDVNKIPFYSPLYTHKRVMVIIPHLFSKTIYKQTNFFIASYIYLAEKLMPPIYKKCHIDVISNSTKEDLIGRGYDPKDISVIECGIDHSIYRPGESKFDRPTVCYTGRLKKYKSVHHLIYAAAEVIKVVPKARFVIIGDGDYLAELKKLTSYLKLENCVEFPGFVSSEEKVKLLQGCHCLAYTSIKEGWGISNIEANACGTAVVAADVPGLRDSVEEGVSGLLYPYGDIKSLSKRIIEILTDNELRYKLEKGATRWASKFTWENTAFRFNELLMSRYLPSE